jgi:hypothetical protein
VDTNSFVQALQGWPAIILWLLGGGSLYKIIDRLLDNRNQGAGREASADLERGKADAERIKELQAMLIPLAEKAALAGFYEKENAKQETQIADMTQKIYNLGVELRQSQTVAGGYKVISELFDDDEGRAFLRRKIEMKREREGDKADLSAKDV